MRTFTRADLERSRREWDEGDFSREWRDVRHRAAMGGVIFPPEGTRWDSWEDAQPSQRAILIRAIRETPTLLDKCIVGADSWYEVIRRLTATLNGWREELDAKDRALARWKAENEPARRGAMAPVRSVLQAWADSYGVDTPERSS